MMVSEEQEVYNLETLKAKKALLKNDLMQTELELKESVNDLFSFKTIKEALFGGVFAKKSKKKATENPSENILGWVTTFTRLAIYGLAGTKRGLKGFLAVNAASAIDRYILPHIGTLKDYISELLKLVSSKTSNGQSKQR